jgi:hypothetical protein
LPKTPKNEKMLCAPNITRVSWPGLFNKAAKILLPNLLALSQVQEESLWLIGGSFRAAFNAHSSYQGDLDVIFFNAKDKSRGYERDIQALVEAKGMRNVSVKNQARMNKYVDPLVYSTIFDSIEAFPDRSVAAAAQLSEDSNCVRFFMPYGADSILAEPIRPTRAFLSKHTKENFYEWCDRKHYGCRNVSLEAIPPNSKKMIAFQVEFAS